MNFGIETKRLYLREMWQSDYPVLCKILQDEETMYAYNGYANEAAKACKEYAFNVLNVEEVFSIIRDTNIASQNVAIRNGMTVTKKFTKHYRGVEMPHWVFSVKNTPNEHILYTERLILRPWQESDFVL